MSHIMNIWRKELMDTIRDKKAFRQALLVPLLVGVFYAVLNPMLTSFISGKADNPIAIPVQGLEHVDETLKDVMQSFGITLISFSGDMEAAIESGEETAGLIVPEGFSDSVANEQPANLMLLLNSSTGGPFRGSFSIERLEAALNAYNRIISESRLQSKGIELSVLNPVGLDARDLSTPAQRAGVFASFMLPILVGVVIVQGGLFIAIDVTAGEKERNTLEALLVTPAGDVDIFIGKLLSVFTMSSLPLGLTMLGYWASSNLLPDSMTDGAVLPIEVVLGALLFAMPLALFINVVMMMVSIRTKTFKDAQSAAVPLNLVVVFTMMGAAFVPPESSIMHLIPIYGTSALVGDLAVGGAIQINEVLLTFAGSLGASAIGIFFALKLFNRERLLYSV